MEPTTFTITKDHLKLLQRAHVKWIHGEYGAPGIDTKRPYGNSRVLEDIHEILTGETIGLTDSKRDELTDKEYDRYDKLHREMETVLQICLVRQRFQTGEFIKTDEYDDMSWCLMETYEETKDLF